MKKVIVILLLVFSTNLLFAQKLYIWKPKTQKVDPRPLYQKTDTIDVVVYDGRVINNKSKVECTSEELVSEFHKVFSNAYSNATLIIHNPAEYTKKSYSNHITIKVGIAAYHAGFGSDIQVGIGSVGGNFSYGFFPKGKWNAITSLYVRVYDKRDGKDIKNEKEISFTDSKSNMLGYTSAKSALNSTYLQAISQMLLVIDNAMMED